MAHDIISLDAEVLNQFITYSFRATLLVSVGHWFSLGLDSRRWIRNSFPLVSFSFFTLSSAAYLAPCTWVVRNERTLDYSQSIPYISCWIK
jgi:L-cystine uptake protein TcyP (sodium:dicarboxylate symporter family)